MGWIVAKERCRLCGYEAIGVFPDETDEDNLQCGNCGHMTAEAVKRYPPGQPVGA